MMPPIVAQAQDNSGRPLMKNKSLDQIAVKKLISVWAITRLLTPVVSYLSTLLAAQRRLLYGG